MAIIQVSVPVSKEAYELAHALHKLVVEIKTQLKDGMSADDIPALLTALMSDEVIKGVQGLDQLDDELKENQEAFINAFATLGSSLVKEFSQG